MKTLVMIYGCFGRSLAYTLKNHKETIFKTLDDDGIDYDTAYINNRVSKIDGCTPNDSILDVIDKTNYIEINQPDAIKQIHARYKNLDALFAPHLPRGAMINLYLNSFIETKCGDYICDNSEKYDRVICFCVDLWFGKQLPMDYLSDSGDNIIVSDQNPGCDNGITNGFYIGTPSIIGQTLRTFNKLESLAPRVRGLDYEKMIYNSVCDNKFSFTPVMYRFIKIRANGRVAYPDNWLSTTGTLWVANLYRSQHH